MEQSVIIGLTGTFAAGKDTVAEYLQDKGFEHYSTGDIVREIAKEQNLVPTRDNLRDLGNELRDKFGADFLAKQIIEKKAKTKKIIVSGIRQPGEVKYLKNLKGFYLLAVDAPAKARFERMKKRQREGDPETLKEMLEKEKKEMESAGINAQQIHKCMQAADKLILNDGDMDLLYKRVDKALEQIEG